MKTIKLVIIVIGLMLIFGGVLGIMASYSDNYSQDKNGNENVAESIQQEEDGEFCNIEKTIECED